MNDFPFWNTWIKPYKTLLLMLLALLAGSILYFITVMLLGSELVIDWQTVATLEELQLPLLQKDFGFFPLHLEADSYVVKQTFLGSDLKVNQWPAYLFLIMGVIGISVALGVISGLRRFWFIVGIALFCVLVVSLRLEQIQLFGRIDKTADILFFLLFLPLSYYFQAIRAEVPLHLRFLAFLALFVLLAVVIYFFAGVNLPFLYIANYGLPGFMVVSFLFILLISPEIIAGILYLVTASNTENSKNSLMHFTMASFIYLGNLALYYLQIRGALDLDIYLISPFWILLVSILVAFFTLKSRSENFSGVIDYQPLGAMLYLALAIICLSTIGYVFATANDPLVETFEDAILYSHLGFGLMFFLYIIANFYGLLKENKRVYRIMYKPRAMPLFSARFAGLIVAFALYSLHGSYAIFQPMGGYYNAIGDLYTADNNFFLAEQYYKLGSQYKIANHRSNYALASLAIKADKPVQAMLFLKDAIERQPTPYAYANLANLYFNNNLYFDGLFTLREGIEHYPREGRLYNNLGLQFGKTNVVDSALYYLQIAARDSELEENVQANELALLANKRIPLENIDYEYRKGDIFYQTNYLALLNQNPTLVQGSPEVNPRVLQELGGIEAAWLLHYALLIEEPDSLLPRQLKSLIDSTPVLFNPEPSGLALGVLFFKQQNHFGSFRTLAELAEGSMFNRGVYYKLLGTWALELNAPALAERFFERAAGPKDGEAAILQALALTEAGKPLEAGEVLVSLPDSLLGERLQKTKSEMLMLLGMQDFSELPANQSQMAYQALRLQWGKLDSLQEEVLIRQIQDLNWKARAFGLLVSKNLQYGSLQEAEKYLLQLQQIPPTQLEEPVNAMRQQLIRQLGVYHTSATTPSDPPAYPGALGDLFRSAYEATLAGDTLQAIQKYRKIMQATPFLEEAYILATPLLNAKGFEAQAYDFLLKAMQFNPYSLVLKEQYILQSLRLNLEEYAFDELQNLREIAEQERFDFFVERFEKLNKETLQESAGW